MSARALHAAYLDTHYVVRTRAGEIVLEIGARSAMARRLCRVWRQNAVVLATRHRAPKLIWRGALPL